MIHTDGTPTVANAPAMPEEAMDRKRESARAHAQLVKAERLERATPAPLHPEVEDLARALAATRSCSLESARRILMGTR